jgi:hypothetical protein
MPRVNSHIDDDEPYPIVKVKKDKTDARMRARFVCPSQP